MSPLRGFRNSIKSADKLLDMYAELRRSRGLGSRGRLEEEHQDLLWLPRSAVVAAMSSLDAYVHDVLNREIKDALEVGEVSESLAEMIAELIPIKSGKHFQGLLGTFLSPDASGDIANLVKLKKLDFLSFQAPDKIIQGFGLTGKGNIFDLVADMWQGPNSTAADLKRTLANFGRRRNQIAHEGDREANGSERPIQPSYAAKCAQYVSNFVERAHQQL